jgi:chromosomal replication initiator protein
MKDLWSRCQQSLKKTLGKTSFDTWIAPLHLQKIKDNTLTLEAPDIFFKKWVESNYSPYIKEALEQNSQQPFTVQLVVNPSLLKKKNKKIFRSIDKQFRDEPQSSLKLNPRFTFDSFIVGASNRMAHATSRAVAEAPGKSYNPLFIYGGVGLGKTHLKQAIAHYIVSKNPKTKVKYTSSEHFTNELIMAIQSRTTQKFRQKYRNIDVLLIDDIHFLSGKEAVQEEFFHTFNVLYDSHKQIVISSDRPPREIPRLEERLISRFSWGLVVDIQPPDFETRVAILKKKLEKEPINVTPEVINFIAENITTNIRELEGALIRIIAYSLIENKEINVDLARDILRDMVKEIDKKITPQLILNKVADYFEVNAADLKKSKRSKSLILPRQVAMYLIRELTELSLPEIGTNLGAKHHTTILYAIRKLKKIMKEDRKVENIVNSLSQEIKNN